MRTLSASLLAAQKEASRTPYVKVEAWNKIAGVVRLDWERLYAGSEDDFQHGVTMPGDGSLVRARITLVADARKLYRQRVASPGPSSDFSSWTYTSQYNCLAVAAASLGSEVSIFWVNTSRELRRIKSTDYGATWGSPELIDYTVTVNVTDMAAAYKPGGDLAVFYTDLATLRVKEHSGGGWQSAASWDKTTGDLSGVAVTYDGDWDLLVTGKDSDDNYHVWSLVYGDGDEVSSGTWSALEELASAPAGGDFEYRAPFLDNPDVWRAFYTESFGGTQAYDRPFWSHAVPDSGFTDSLWRESVPFDLSAAFGLAVAHSGSYCWLSCPFGVWRAGLAAQSLDLSADVLSLAQETGDDEGRLSVELRNEDGQYASPGEGAISVLDTGCQLEVSPGYVTSQGDESSFGPAYWLEAYEHVGSASRATVVLLARGGWHLLEQWRARHQFRWNKDGDEKSVKDILRIVLAKVGLALAVESESSTVTGFYPDFTISPGSRGTIVLARLLSFVPDVVFIDGAKAYLVHPQSADSSVYSYGQGHAILRGSYRTGAWDSNRVRVEGYDPVGDAPIIVDSFDWDELGRLHDRLLAVDDRNIETVARAGDRGTALLRKAEILSVGGAITVPVNCGQQPYDVIDVTDDRAGMSAEKRRVAAISLAYRPERGEYRQRLSLAAV